MGYRIKVVRVFFKSGPNLLQKLSQFTWSEFTGTHLHGYVIDIKKNINFLYIDGVYQSWFTLIVDHI